MYRALGVWNTNGKVYGVLGGVFLKNGAKIGAYSEGEENSAEFSGENAP